VVHHLRVGAPITHHEGLAQRVCAQNVVHLQANKGEVG